MRYLRAVDLPPNQAHFTWNGVWLPDEAAALLEGRDLQQRGRLALAELAMKHDASAEEETTEPKVAYARFPSGKETEFVEDWLP